MTPERRKQIEAMVAEYRKGYTYNQKHDAPQATEDLLGEIDRLTIERDELQEKMWEATAIENY
jgi:hypothetical protein